jgi:hypothetical protein
MADVGGDVTVWTDEGDAKDGAGVVHPAAQISKIRTTGRSRDDQVRITVKGYGG